MKKKIFSKQTNRVMMARVIVGLIAAVVITFPIANARICTPLASKGQVERYAADNFGPASVVDVQKEKDKVVYTMTDKEGRFEYQITSYRTNNIDGKASVFWKEFKEDTFTENYCNYLIKTIAGDYPIKMTDGKVYLKYHTTDPILASNAANEITKLDTRKFFDTLNITIQTEEGKDLGVYLREDKKFLSPTEYEEYSTRIMLMDIAKTQAKKEVVFVKKVESKVADISGLVEYKLVDEEIEKCNLYYYECEGKSYYIADFKIINGRKTEYYNTYRH